MALWGALGAAARRYLERARDLEWEQERRLLEAYVRAGSPGFETTAGAPPRRPGAP